MVGVRGVRSQTGNGHTHQLRQEGSRILGKCLEIPRPDSPTGCTCLEEGRKRVVPGSDGSGGEIEDGAPPAGVYVLYFDLQRDLCGLCS